MNDQTRTQDEIADLRKESLRIARNMDAWGYDGVSDVIHALLSRHDAMAERLRDDQKGGAAQ